MSTLANHVSQAGLADYVLQEGELRDVLGGGDARRYGLVNRALKDGSLHRLKRGVYLLDNRYRDEPAHPFAVAQGLHPGSYISFESALSYHGWIPEAVFTTACVTPGRKTLSFETGHMGLFTFHPLATQDFQFLMGVERVKMGVLTALVAKPLRALMDLVALRKQPWTGLGWLTSGMRIDEQLFMTLGRKDFASLRHVYKYSAASAFLKALESEIMALKARRAAEL